jgi:ABC-2 type transport system ATP-binding protein
MKLELKEIKKNFGDKLVLKGAGFVFEKGRIYGLLGRNGAGKTTLFNCLSGELEMDGGEALLVEDDITQNLTPENVGFVFTTPILPEFLTGYEFLKFFIDINKGRTEISKTIDEYFELVKIEPEDRHRLIKGYSHGMKNKIQMLCFIISRPPVILLDEPLTSFDVIVALEMKKLLRDIRKGHIIIFSTHILQLATDLCDEIVVLTGGVLEQVDHDMLHSREFESKIIEMLQDEGNAENEKSMDETGSGEK